MGNNEEQTTTIPEFINRLGISPDDKQILLLCFDNIIDNALDGFARMLIARFTDQDEDSEEYNAMFNKNLLPLVQQYRNIICKALHDSVNEETNNE